MVRGKARGRAVLSRSSPRKSDPRSRPGESYEFVPSLSLLPIGNPLRKAYNNAWKELGAPPPPYVERRKAAKASVRDMERAERAFGPRLIEFCRILIRECYARGLVQERNLVVEDEKSPLVLPVVPEARRSDVTAPKREGALFPPRRADILFEVPGTTNSEHRACGS